jgi:hypothetical protein
MVVRYAVDSKDAAKVHAEFAAFLQACPDEAGDSWAILYHISATGLGGLDSDVRRVLIRTQPYCHQAAGWAVFFEVTGRQNGPCDVTLLLVAELSQLPIDMALSSALQRSRP